MTAPLLRLVVLYGGVSAEHEVSCITATHVLAAADRSKYDLLPIGISREGRWYRNDEAIAALADGRDLTGLTVTGTEIEPLSVFRGEGAAMTVALPLLHGPHGEDGTIQGMLELFGIPYVGSGVLGSAVCMDKAMAKVVAAQAGIPQCKWVTYRDRIDNGRKIVAKAIDQLGLPVFVKPANMGSSVGISKASTAEELDAAINLALRYDDVVVIEEAVDAREIEVGALGNAMPDTTVPGEVLPGSDFYDYEDKYVTGNATLQIPADLPEKVTEQARAMAVKAFRALRCTGMARIDFFYEADGRGLLLNEINTIPGFTPASMYPKMWEASGMPYPDLIDRLVTLAIKHHRRRSSLATDH